MSKECFADILNRHLYGKDFFEQEKPSYSKEIYSASLDCLDCFSFKQQISNSQAMGKQSYQNKNLVFEIESKPQDSPLEFSITEEHLDLYSLSAVELFKRHGESLVFPLTEKGLKQAWRRIAKRTHPDLSFQVKNKPKQSINTSASDELNFHVCHDAYEILQNLFRAA